jgi:hypothetical protein
MENGWSIQSQQQKQTLHVFVQRMASFFEFALKLHNRHNPDTIERLDLTQNLF